MKSIFTDKNITPAKVDLEHALGKSINLWNQIEDYTKKSCSAFIDEWNYSSPKYGWSYRIKDKKRVLVYLLPRDNFFKVAMVFGDKAFQKIIESDISMDIINELKAAKAYAEGRGIRIDIMDNKLIEDVKKLILIKIGS